MHINYEPLPQNKTKKSSNSQFFNSFKITNQNIAFAALGTAIAGYIGYTDPYILLTVMFSLVVAGSLYFITACLPLVSKKLDFKLSIWHVLAIAGGLTIALNAFEPSHALFLSGLETAVTDLLDDSASVEDAQIELIFTFIRIALILVALGGGFAAWQQQQQGQSMTPIIMFLAGLFGIVLSIDILTAVVIGA